MTPLKNFVEMSEQTCVMIGARNYEWAHGIMNGFPTVLRVLSFRRILMGTE
jgi:hypothetical protein